MRLSDFVPLVPVLLQGLVVDAGRDVGYGEMRLPDFLGYSSLDSQVEPHAERWRALLEMGCHPRAGVFFCSWLHRPRRVPAGFPSETVGFARRFGPATFSPEKSVTRHPGSGASDPSGRRVDQPLFGMLV
ncbi:secreted frizzled-related protein 5-like [Arapaima gigas]